MQELVGDAGRDGDWAWVTLTVSRGRIKEARGDGPGVAEVSELGLVWSGYRSAK